MLTYLSSAKLTALLSSETGVQDSLGNEHVRNKSAWVLTSCCNADSGYTSTKWVCPVDKTDNFVVQGPLLQIYHWMYTNSKILTTLDAHIFSTRLRFEFILIITWNSTQQFPNHIPVYCLSNSSLTKFPLLWWRSIAENRRHCIGLQHLLEGQNPSSMPSVKSSGRKMFGTDQSILITKWRVLQTKLS